MAKQGTVKKLAPELSNPPTEQTVATVAQPTMSKPRDLDRDRAVSAWENIQTVKGQSYEKDYSSLARQLPTMIQVKGLAPTLMFLEAKGESHHKQAFDHLSSWVCSRFNWSDSNLLDKILAQDVSSQHYRFITAEALTFLQWIKRFAEAELDTED